MSHLAPHHPQMGQPLSTHRTLEGQDQAWGHHSGCPQRRDRAVAISVGPPEAGPSWGCHSEPPGVSLLLRVLLQVLLPLLLHHLVELHGGSGVLHRGVATFPYL